jgi:23S rRNA (guanosine2251-2'-O)-methyltransferase
MPRPTKTPAVNAKPGRRPGGHRPAPREGGGRGGALIHGLHPVAAAWINPERVCRRLLVTEAGLAGLADALAQAAAEGLDRPQPTTIDKTELDRMLPGAVHQGVALDAEPLREIDADDVIRLAEDLDRAAVVVLDQVTDPHNVGAVLRSAAAFGALAVFVTERHAPEVTGTLAKAASGALEAVPLVRVVNLARTLTTLSEGGFWCLGFAESGERTLGSFTLPGRVALVMGAEGPGLRRLTKERCDELVRLPTQPPIGSLNVSNAAAVALYEVARTPAP